MSVVRDKDTGLSKCFGFVSMQASDGAKKALLKQVLRGFFVETQLVHHMLHPDTHCGQSNHKSDSNLPTSKTERREA